MKYAPKYYARAFADVALKHKGVSAEEKTIARFLSTIRKNGDWGALPKIVAEAERLVLKKSGLRKVTFQSARPQSKILKESFARFLKHADIVKEEIHPELIAGTKIIVNDELEFDGSLKRKIDKLFSA